MFGKMFDASNASVPAIGKSETSTDDRITIILNQLYRVRVVFKLFFKLDFKL